MREGYDIAQICLNGHVINSMAYTAPNHNKAFCGECGAETIMECGNCKAKIKGTYHYPGIAVMGIDFEASKFCDNCGEQFPWTKTQLEVAEELIDLADSLNPKEKTDLYSNIDELVKESPKVPVAQIKVKRLLSKVDKDISNGIHDALAEIISQQIQNEIW